MLYDDVLGHGVEYDQVTQCDNRTAGVVMGKDKKMGGKTRTGIIITKFTECLLINKHFIFVWDCYLYIPRR